MMKTGIESQISENTIPSLTPMDSCAMIDNVLSCNRDSLEECLAGTGYVEYFVDQFKDVLSENSSELELLNDGYYKLKKEVDYINFLHMIFKENGSSVLLFNLGIDFSDIEVCIDKIERLDTIDRYIIFNLYKNYTNNNIYVINDKTLFEFFIRGFLREAIPGTLYFEKLDIFLSFGYDMVLPIFFKEDKLIGKYKNYAKKYNLYIRR